MLTKVMRYPEKIPCDKRIHFIVGVFIGVITVVLHINIVYAILTTVVVGYAVEFVQKFTNSGQFEHMDAVAVILGGLAVILPSVA